MTSGPGTIIISQVTGALVQAYAQCLEAGISISPLGICRRFDSSLVSEFLCCCLRAFGLSVWQTAELQEGVSSRLAPGNDIPLRSG